MTEDSILGRVMLAFEGERVPEWVEERLARAPVAGVTLFVHDNVRSPGQVRELTAALQAAVVASGFAGPLLVASDQEGGQLLSLGDGSTGFAGNMALGAVGDPALTERVGVAIGREARAMGVNLVYGPALDLATEPSNAAMGTRSFGDDPEAVGRHGAAMVRGLQSAGVAATVKHFPGLGAATADTHHGGALVGGTRAQLDARELAPFRAAIAAGARVAMSAHVAVPALTGEPALPATLSRAVMTGTLRTDLGFGGVSITDALDMAALAQGAAQAVDIIAAVRAGIDLLLATADRTALARIEETLVAAASRGLFEAADLAASAARLAALREWLAAAEPAPAVDVVGSPDHRALSRELAERALTRTDDGPPLVWAASTRILAIMPRPTDLTPADTSSLVVPGLGRALRTRFASVEEVVVDIAPSDADIAALRERADGFDAIVVGTIEAHRQRAQAALVGALAATGRPIAAAALRTPWDCATYPAGVPAVCTYSILPDPLEALARALAGEIGFPGPVPGRAVTLHDEILEQPEVAARFLADQADTVESIAADLRARPPSHVVIAARGTSDNAAIYAQYVLGVRHRIPVGLGTPSIVSVYDVAPDFGETLVVGISQSGASPDIVSVVAAAAAQGAPTIAITNSPDSALARAADHTIALGAGPELAVAATKTYTAELLAIAALSAAMAGDPTDRAAVAALPATIAAVLELEPDLRRIAADQAMATRALVIARGFEYATAREWALKLKELALVFADPYSSADFQHGPLALVEPGVPVLAVARNGVTAAALVALIDRLRVDLGAEVMVVSDADAALADATWPVRLPGGTPEWLGPIVSIVAGQLHALHLTEARGLDPESPRNLLKVTRTT